MSITVTERAGEELRRLLKEVTAEQPEAELGLRVSVRGQCHCGAVHFGMAFDQGQEEDTVLDAGDLKIFLDTQAAPLVEGAEIDYVEELTRQGFALRNVKAGGCQCGSQ